MENKRAYTVYDITFKDGSRMTLSEQDGIKNRLQAYNWACRAARNNKLIAARGGVESIDCRPMPA